MKKAVILCSLDGYANSLKSNQLKLFFERHGYEAELYPTTGLGRLGNLGLKRWLPYPGFRHIKLYFFEGLYAIAHRQKDRRFKRIINSLVLQRMVELRGVLLNRGLSAENIDVLICENNFDAACVFHRIAKMQVLDLPTPLAEELFYGDELSRQKYTQFSAYEKEIYSKADFISFHWYTYAEFVKKEKYNGNNFINLGWGADFRKKKAHYSKKPRIAFLGYLGGYWSNLALLEQLSELYPYIDVYGGPPVSKLKINYKGYRLTSEVLADYQFGLITITDDVLRRNGFSAKHVDYFSYGLPVLVPEWRKDPILESGSIYYNPGNFLSLIDIYSNRQKWEEKSNATLAAVQNFTWDNALAPLVDKIVIPRAIFY